MSTAATLPPRHFALALAVVAVWGSNFVVIKIGLDALPPLLFAALRFTLAVLPAMFFLPRPAVPWTNLAAYGLLIGVGQFGLLYLAMRGHISPGLASLVVQMQVFFTVLLAARLNGESVRPYQWAALTLAAAGIVVIGSHAGGATTGLGVAMVLGAGLSWAGGNLVGKRAGQVNMLAYMGWTSAFAAPPLFALSWLVEGRDAIAAGLAGATPGTWAAVLWQSIGNTLFGYGVWGWLLARHAAATVVPMALLVPVFGMGCAALLLGEPLPAWKLTAAALVTGGLALNLLWPLRRGAEERKEQR